MRTIEKFQNKRKEDDSLKSRSPIRHKLSRKISLLEVSRDFGYDEDGVKKSSIYWKPKEDLKPKKGECLNSRKQSFFQSMRDGDVSFVPTTTKNKHA